MESLSRPPHRRKHSATGHAFSSNSSASSFSFKNPYEGLLSSNGGKAKFGAHEYAEIFSGSSSIPVLDLSCLEERLGSGDCRSSKLDYSNIFGGLRDDEVGVPYEELFNGAAAKKTKTRISGKTKNSSGDLSDESTDGIKKHVNMSFNKTSQRINDASNGTHIAKLHAVPGFTCFVDGTRQRTEVDRSVTSLKREVSRTWSFSAGVETQKDSEKSNVSDKSCNVNEVKKDNKAPRCSKLPSFGFTDFSRKIAEEDSPPSLDEEFDENSVAAVSAAALKKAIEHAQESIRIAKMIMERRKEGLQDSPKCKSQSRLKVKDKKEIRTDQKNSPSLCDEEIFINAGNVEVEMVRENNVEGPKEYGDTFADGDEECAQSETDYVAEKGDLVNVDQNVEAMVAFAGLVSNAEMKNEEETNDNLECSRNEIDAEMAEEDRNISERVREQEKSVDEALEQSRATVDPLREPENIAEVWERVQSCSWEKILHEEGVDSRINQEDEAVKETDDDVADDNGNCEEKFVNNLLEQEDMERKPKDVSHSHIESHDEEKVNIVHETEMDDEKLNYVHVEDEQNLPGVVEKNENAAERHMDTSEYEDADTLRKSEVTQNAEETNYSFGEDQRSEENQGEFDFQEAASEKYFDEVVDESSTVSCEAQAEEYEEAVKGNEENDSLPSETESSASGLEDKEAAELFDEIMPETDSLRRSASEENFIGSKLNNACEGASSDSNTENISSRDSDSEEKVPEDEEMSGTSNETHNGAEEDAAKINMQNLPEVYPSVNKTAELDQTSNDGFVLTSIHENTDEMSSLESQGCDETSNSNNGKVKNDLDTCSNESQNVEKSNCENKETGNAVEVEREVETNQNKNKENQKDVKVSEHKYEAANERIEAIKRGRAREKDRIAVERAIREARERAFAEARERAEREKAAAEARQRAKQSADKASAEAKIKAERAAVERATAEARERALEKAMSHKNSAQAEREKSSSSRNNGLKHSYSSSDLEKFDEAGSESAQRRKARLERHQRIMERAAKALAEKNMRDIHAQKEQAERNRLAESLDADIKRWATGKEGNLRALLSTLQYILGQESGWQPISLTEIITTAAVKKAYRKATLCVHPDKLQQRGASVQQKYICEKVFDLLKAAWNRFNSEER